MKKRDRILVGIGVAFAVAAVGTLVYIRQNRKNHPEKPPRNAPQVPIENPGDQSEFVSAASPSELG